MEKKLSFEEFQAEMKNLQAEAKKKQGWVWRMLCGLGIHSKTVYWKHVRDGDGDLTVMIYCHRCFIHELVKT